MVASVFEYANMEGGGVGNIRWMEGRHIGGGGIYPCHPPHTDEHVVDEVHWNNVCYTKFTAPHDPQHPLPSLGRERGGKEGERGRRGWGGERKGEERREERGR